MATTKVRTTTVERNTDEDEQNDDEAPAAPLFDLNADKKSKSIDRISVYRVDPDEGHLGYLPHDADEKDIKSKWGGGEYRLQAKNNSGQIVKTLSSYRISGDPIFQSDIAEARWMRLNRIPSRNNANGDGPSSVREVIATLQEQDKARRDEERERREEERRDRLEREEKARAEQRAHEERLAKDQAEREERRRRDEEEREDRRRKEQREDEERRARLHREDMERLEKGNAAQLLQTQQFFQQLAAMTKSESKTAAAADPIKLLTTGMDIALKLGGRGGAGDGEPPDALTALLSRLPETLGELRETGRAAYAEIQASKAAKKGAPRQLSPRASDDGGAAVASDADHPEVTISGPTAGKLQRAIEILKAAGKDPEAVISGMAEHVIKLRERPPTPARSKPRAPAGRARPARAATARAKPAAAPKRAAARRRSPAAGKGASTP